MRAKFRLIILISFALLSIAVPVSAREIQQGDQCRILPAQTIEGDLFVLCRTLEIDGVVQGNVIGAATTARIDGRVEGSLYLIAGQLDLNGLVGGSVHFAGAALRIGETVDFEESSADLFSASLSTTLDADARIPDDVIGIGYQLVLDGEVGDEVNFWGSSLNVGGTIGGDVNANVGDSQSAGVGELQALLTILPVSINLERPGLRVEGGAQIDGQLHYSAPSEGVIETELAQPPEFDQVYVQPDLTQIAVIGEQPEDVGRELALFAGQAVREFVTLVVIGALILLITPSALPAPLRSISARPLSSLGLGLLTFVISFPVVVILLLFSLLIVFILALLQLGDFTIAGGVLLGAADLAVGSVFYFVAIFVSRAIVGLGLGRLIARAVRPGLGGRNSQYVQLALGAILLALVFSLPVVGWFLSALAAFLGLGAILTQLQSQMDARRRSPYIRPASQMALPSRSEEAWQFPPPMLDSGSHAPGMENLPTGFRWWDDD